MKKRYFQDRPAAGRAAVPPARHRTEPQHPDDPADGRHSSMVELQDGVGNLLAWTPPRLELMHLVMDEEVKSLAGERHQQHEHLAARIAGVARNDGYCVVDGQKVLIKRTRLRSGDNREQRYLWSCRTVSARRALAAWRLGQDDAEAFHAQLRCGGQGTFNPPMESGSRR